ncbi:ABC transporter ATP-binding protein [Mariniblastus fucicola]|uniref:Lipoprotein-releasing system ATP-binding protein LolD n=1 Tax=Mariniblastus fucicola TaxID=980251 RepID=A0A5B9PFQ1_9BACT|nr:ABC transporter ATP-binding protein [Mariniblastus fucicola]QEG24389.1 Lipoprotein-releasing system ATP-binding protein LolD [Mariniblastus fucicola]
MADFVASNIVKEFQTPAQTLRILDGVSLELDRGQNVAIVGESGSGKSTFLHIIGSLDQATSGTVELLGKNVSELNEGELASHRNANVGFVFQQHHLLPQLSALDNVLVPTLATGKPDSAMIDRAKSLLESVGLADRMTHKPGLLSGGEQQRVAVARALICEPVLLLADEPTGSLDAANADSLGSLLLEVQQESNSILICVTHSGKLAGDFSRTIRLEKGKFV